MLRYNNLSKDAGKKIWEWFIERACTFKGLAKVKPNKLNRLVNSKLNGWQVSYYISTTSLTNLLALDQEHCGNSICVGHEGEELRVLFSS